jgi:hypothetical protein
MPSVPDPAKINAFNREAEEVFPRVERRALENYLAELVKGFGLEYDRMQAVNRLKPERWVLLDVEVQGEFPDTCLRIKFRQTVREEEGWQSAAIWKDPTFFDREFNPRMEPADMAVDILTMFRGG